MKHGYGGPKMRSHAGSGKKGDKGMREKCGLEGAALPGKAQSRDRSGGVKRCPIHPDSKGL